MTAVWRQSCRIEYGIRCGLRGLPLPWDLRKCYENVKHLLLAEEAAFVEYPMTILRVNIAFYRWPRTVRLDPLVGTEL